MIEKSNEGKRDGRFTVVLLFVTIFLTAIIGDSLFSNSSSDNRVVDCKELAVTDERQLHLQQCRDDVSPFAAKKLPSHLTPFFFAPVQINRADKEMLMTVKGIGPALAERILAYRRSFGFFDNADDLRKVRGVGWKKTGALAPELNFSEVP